MALTGHGTRSNCGHNRHSLILYKPLQKAATRGCVRSCLSISLRILFILFVLGFGSLNSTPSVGWAKPIIVKAHWLLPASFRRTLENSYRSSP